MILGTGNGRKQAKIYMIHSGQTALQKINGSKNAEKIRYMKIFEIQIYLLKCKL